MATLHTSHFQVNPVTSTSYAHSLVFIDMAVENYSDLVNGVVDNAEAFVLDSTQNGVEQITEILASCVDAQGLVARHRPNLTNIHIVCHGAPGCLQLGNTHLGLDTLDEYSQQLQWQKIFSVSAKSDNPWNLLIYGCNVALGDAGTEFIDKLHQLTKANIAASRQRIGNAALGGNWELEVRTTEMEASLAFVETTRQTYAGVLATFTVNNTGDIDDGDRNNGITTLREAINLANATAGDDAIAFGGIFKDTTPDTITLTSGQLTITDDVTILGTGTSKLTVSGKNASTLFEISGLGTGVNINGLAIASGSIKVNRTSILNLAKSSVSGNTAGSAISNSGILSLANTSVFGNKQGGIYNGGTLSLTGSSVYGNTWESSSVSANNNNLGGGIYNDASEGKTGTLSLINSSVSGNTANFGGGIYSGGTFRLINSTVSGNTALNDGGGIYNAGVDYDAGSAILVNTTISGNTALNDGGGIYNGFAYVSGNS
jgi:CSLREA domain-containing protein